MPGSRCEDFVPWVFNQPDDPQDLEEEERMERTVGLLDRYAARKRKRQVSSSGESDAAPTQSADLSSSPTSDKWPLHSSIRRASHYSNTVRGAS